MTITVPAPTSFGLPPRFSAWRQSQQEAVFRALDSPYKFIGLCAPTGFGKSLAYMAMASISGARTVVLTSTKGLQTQLMRDFEEMGIVDVRGMNNYDCLEETGDEEHYVYRGRDGGRKVVKCDQGPCHVGYKCLKRDGGCLYFDAVSVARESQLVVTNYAYWLTANALGEGIGRAGLLVLDEAHDAPGELASFLHIEMTASEIEGMLHTRFLDEGADISQWRDWASYHRENAQERLDELVRRIKFREDGPVSQWRNEARVLRDLVRRLKALSEAEGNWVAERRGRSMSWDPVWPREYAHRHLFGNADKVIMVSATLRPKTASLLGIRESEFDFMEYKSAFPVHHRPIYQIPTITLNRNTGADRMKTWIARIDQIIKPRLDRKGIIHTVSYERRNMIIRHSEYRDMMMSHDTGTARATVEKFKRMPAPAILVSPSMGTGWDFPYDECRWMIIGKVPFPDTRSKIMQARGHDDPHYSSYLAMQELVQMSGRAVRAEDDWAETFVIDDSLGWFMNRNGQFAPMYFKEAIIWRKTGMALPVPPPAL